MSASDKNRLYRPETLTALGIIVVAAGLLVPTAALQPISALLPAAMLIGLIGLSVALLVRDQRKAGAGDIPEQVTTAPKRVLLAFLLIFGYALCVDFIGFYVSTAAVVPLVAYVFGYRNPLGLAIATVIVLVSIYTIFDLGMSREFPVGRLWKN